MGLRGVGYYPLSKQSLGGWGTVTYTFECVWGWYIRKVEGIYLDIHLGINNKMALD